MGVINGHASDLGSENSNYPLVNSLVSSTSPCAAPTSLTPTPPSTSIFFIITPLEPYILPKLKITHQPSTLTSSGSLTQTVPSSSHPRSRPSTTTNHFPLSSLFGTHLRNKYFHIPAHAPYSVNTFYFKKYQKTGRKGDLTFLT